MIWVIYYGNSTGVKTWENDSIWYPNAPDHVISVAWELQKRDKGMTFQVTGFVITSGRDFHAPYPPPLLTSQQAHIVQIQYFSWKR